MMTQASAWHELRARLVTFVTRRIDTPDDAEDIVQDVLLKVSQGIGGVREHERLEAWVYQIARNTIVDHHRRNRTRTLAHARAVLDRSFASEPDVGSSVLTGCLRSMIDRLPEHYREAITLTEYDGLTQADAAERLGLSVPGMKSRVQRARARLGELIAECCRVELDVRRAVRHVEPHGPCPC
ncbi:RNA polymerase sigma factor SigZ [Nonomuraea sp. NPDC050556]|uniref:RNA polymerase sigma factor SigZ n=1 Tax=Nonomuraea sp. NPDC050556 TaxID=3364369 RepID=UPI003799CD36